MRVPALLPSHVPSFKPLAAFVGGASLFGESAIPSLLNGYTARKGGASFTGHAPPFTLLNCYTSCKGGAGLIWSAPACGKARVQKMDHIAPAPLDVNCGDALYAGPSFSRFPVVAAWYLPVRAPPLSSGQKRPPPKVAVSVSKDDSNPLT